MSRTQRWEERLARFEAEGRLRRLRNLSPLSATEATLDGRRVLVACSNDYLGLAHHPEVLAAARGAGSTGSRLISGNRPVHHQLEDALGEWLDADVLLFPSGYQANLAVGSTLCEPGDRVASDALNHASIIDGLRLGKAQRVVVPHAQPAEIPGDVRAVFVESLYSMDGDIPDLRSYPRAPWLVVDEAHAIGAMGPSGRGVAAQQGVEADALVGTFGKAFGVAGAFVAGSPALRSLLINAGRSFIFSTGMPESVAAQNLAALRILQREPGLRERLAQNAQRLRTALTQLGWRVLGDAHILPVVVGPSVMQVARDLEQAGVFAPGIRYPTVARGFERIRFTVSAAHLPTDIDQIADAMGPCPS